MTDLDPELLIVRQRRRELLRAKIAAVKANGLAFYRPWAKQDAFHRSLARRRMFRAGNRTGKSTCGIAEDCAWLRGERPWYAKTDPARYSGIPKHPVKGLVITTDWDKVDEIFTSERGDNPGKLWKFIPKDAVVSKRRNHSGAIDTVEIKSALYDGNSLLRFDTVKSFKSNPMGSESSDWDFIHGDEPFPELMWKASARGLIDRGGFAWFTLTALSEPWINDFFFPEDTGGLARTGVWAETATIYENPFLKAEDIADYEATLDEEEKQCRLLGIPMHLAGLVYKNFSWNRHVLTELPKGWDDWTHPPKDWPLHIHIDPHPQTPHAVLFCVVSPFGERFYYYDMFVKCSIAELSQKILEFVGDRRINAVHCDPLGYIEHPVSKESMATEFWRCGIQVLKATKALEHGIIYVNGELKKSPNTMFFSPYCKRTLWEIQRYCWDAKNDRPVDAEDHMMENLYRMELTRPRYFAPQNDPPTEDEVINSPRFDLDEVVSLSLN